MLKILHSKIIKTTYITAINFYNKIYGVSMYISIYLVLENEQVGFRTTFRTTAAGGTNVKFIN